MRIAGVHERKPPRARRSAVGRVPRDRAPTWIQKRLRSPPSRATLPEPTHATLCTHQSAHHTAIQQTCEFPHHAQRPSATPKSTWPAEGLDDDERGGGSIFGGGGGKGSSRRNTRTRQPRQPRLHPASRRRRWRGRAAAAARPRPRPGRRSSRGRSSSGFGFIRRPSAPAATRSSCTSACRARRVGEGARRRDGGDLHHRRERGGARAKQCRIALPPDPLARSAGMPIGRRGGGDGRGGAGAWAAAGTSATSSGSSRRRTSTRRRRRAASAASSTRRRSSSSSAPPRPRWSTASSRRRSGTGRRCSSRRRKR